MNELLLKFLLSTRLQKNWYTAPANFICDCQKCGWHLWFWLVICRLFVGSIKDIVGESFIEDDADDQQKGEILYVRF